MSPPLILLLHKGYLSAKLVLEMALGPVHCHMVDPENAHAGCVWPTTTLLCLLYPCSFTVVKDLQSLSCQCSSRLFHCRMKHSENAHVGFVQLLCGATSIAAPSGRHAATHEVGTHLATSHPCERMLPGPGCCWAILGRPAWRGETPLLD